MKYNGIELTPITTPQIFDPPKEMLVWDENYNAPLIQHVVAITSNNNFCVITVDSVYSYCAEIPKQKTKRATYLQLAEWLAKGNGMWRRNPTKFADIGFSLHIDEENRELEEGEFSIRPFGTTEWLEPTLDNMEIEDK